MLSGMISPSTATDLLEHTIPTFDTEEEPEIFELLGGMLRDRSSITTFRCK
jgi:hypothetical protein